MEAQEIWKPVVGYEGFYEVSDFGRVKSLPRKGAKGGMLKPYPNEQGYLKIDLYKNGKKRIHKVHQLIMRAFVGECPDGYEVDHYDWNPKNNSLGNLSYQPKEVNRARHSPEGQKNIYEAVKKRAADPEWRKNHAEAMKKLAQDPEWLRKNAEAVRKARSKPVDQFTLDGQFVKRWPSTREAARELGLTPANICHCLNGEQHTAGGYIWRFAD